MKNKARKIFTAVVFLLFAAFYIANLIEIAWSDVLVIVATSAIVAAFANLIWRLFAFLNRSEKQAQS